MACDCRRPSACFSIDLMALRALRDRSIMGLFIWANMVLVALFSFLSQNIMPRKFICLFLFILLGNSFGR